jgi:hypothetical protein
MFAWETDWANQAITRGDILFVLVVLVVVFLVMKVIGKR